MTNPQNLKSFCEVIANPKIFHSKPITLKATAFVLYGGILLNSDSCQLPDVSLHYQKDYERHSNAQALALLQRLDRRVRQAHSRDDVKGERAIVSVVLEGALEQNPYYHATWAQGAATLAAWDYNEEYSFVVTRVVSVRRP